MTTNTVRTFLFRAFTFGAAVLFVLSTASTAVAQSSARGRGKTSSKTHPLKKNYYQIQTSYHLWQESVEATSALNTSKIMMQFHGVRLGASLNRPRKSIRWVESYSAELGLGIAKGKGALPLTDELKDQPWLSLSFTPGMLYRTTSRSEVGFIAPLIYRLVQWDVQDPLTINEKAFSVGLGGTYIHRFNLKSSFHVSVVHQHMWNATIWSIGWQHDLR